MRSIPIALPNRSLCDDLGVFPYSIFKPYFQPIFHPKYRLGSGFLGWHIGALHKLRMSSVKRRLANMQLLSPMKAALDKLRSTPL
jgi:hypothetical protein